MSSVHSGTSYTATDSITYEGDSNMLGKYSGICYEIRILPPADGHKVPILSTITLGVANSALSAETRELDAFLDNFARAE